jgi:hypothetical protein
VLSLLWVAPRSRSTIPRPIRSLIRGLARFLPTLSNRPSPVLEQLPGQPPTQRVLLEPFVLRHVPIDGQHVCSIRRDLGLKPT